MRRFSQVFHVLRFQFEVGRDVSVFLSAAMQAPLFLEPKDLNSLQGRRGRPGYVKQAISVGECTFEQTPVGTTGYSLQVMSGLQAVLC
jgi:hypothetical protein